MEEFIGLQKYHQIAKASQCPVLPQALAPVEHDLCTGWWCRAGGSLLCQWLTWSQSALVASHQSRMGVPPSQLLGWVLLFSANIPQLLGSRMDSTRSESENSHTFSKWDLVLTDSPLLTQIRSDAHGDIPYADPRECGFFLCLPSVGMRRLLADRLIHVSLPPKPQRNSNLLGSFPWHS